MTYSDDDLKAYLERLSLDWKRLVLQVSVQTSPKLIAYRADEGDLLAFISDDAPLCDALESFLIRMGQVEAFGTGDPSPSS